MSEHLEEIYKNLVSCKKCPHKKRKGHYQICCLMPEYFYPEGPLAAIAQGFCVRHDIVALYKEYINKLEKEEKDRFKKLLEKESNG